MALAKNHPAYTEEERQAMKNYSREEITIENDKGEPITKSRYEWSQEMRRLETAMRREGDIRTAASVPNGDPTLARQCGVNIQRFQDAYEKIHQATGIDTRYESTPLPKSNTHIPIDTNLPNPESNASTMLKVDITADGNVQKISVNPEFVINDENRSYSGLTKYQNSIIINNTETKTKRDIWLENGYKNALKDEKISALTGIDAYKRVADSIEKRIVGIDTADGLKISDYKTHFIDRMIGDYNVKREGVDAESIINTLKHPDRIVDSVTESGKKSRLYITKECSVSINPDTHTLIQVTGRKRQE